MFWTTRKQLSHLLSGKLLRIFHGEDKPELGELFSRACMHRVTAILG